MRRACRTWACHASIRRDCKFASCLPAPTVKMAKKAAEKKITTEKKNVASGKKGNKVDDKGGVSPLCDAFAFAAILTTKS